MDSQQTRLARTEAQQAEKDWKRHQGDCRWCRHTREPCAAGGPLRLAMREAKASFQRNRELDRMVPENQEALF